LTGAGGLGAQAGKELVEAGLDLLAYEGMAKFKPVLLFLFVDVQLTNVLLFFYFS